MECEDPVPWSVHELGHRKLQHESSKPYVVEFRA